MLVRIDQRIGGLRRESLVEEGTPPLMRVPNEIRKCVTFLYRRTDEGNFVPHGTTFLVAYRVLFDGVNQCFYYAVTAKHNLDKIEAQCIDHNTYLRFNPPNFSPEMPNIHYEEWYVHPTADVAVIPIAWGPGIDNRGWPIVEGIVNEETIRTQGIGPGEDIFIAGLFGLHVGKTKNIPIIRTGSIAAMPEEQIEIKVKENGKKVSKKIDAYLIDSKSFGGLSGSPVFVHLGIVRRKDDNGERSKIEHSEKPEGRIYLLGLISGHYRKLIMTRKKEIFKEVNLGIAFVVPAEKILEVIEGVELTKARNLEMQKLTKNKTAGAVLD
jgi:hypothetical protein